MTTQSEQINELAAALSKAQGAMQNATMNRTNPHFKSKYADLSSVLDAIRAPLSASGLAVVQTMQSSEGRLVLRTTLMHSSGQFVSTEYPLPNSQKPHEMGSALTYARRYSLSALICNSSDEDDDGNAAMASKNGNGNGHAANGSGGNEAISQEDMEQLRAAIDEAGADIQKLCNYFKVPGLAQITSAMLPNVYSALNARRARQ